MEDNYISEKEQIVIGKSGDSMRISNWLGSWGREDKLQ